MPKKKEEKPIPTPKNEPKKEVSYDAKDIYVLEGLEPVRKRPGMYIGSTGVDGLHHLVWEVMDNSIDEAMAGYAKNIRIEILKGNRIVVVDDGRGIPVDIHPQTKKSALDTVLTTLHAGGKFGGESYKVSGGLHGVGVSVVNALSKWLKVEVYRNGAVYTQEYERGKPKFNVKKVGAAKHTGTKVIFDADPEIFQKIEYDRKKILDHLRQQTYLTKGVRISFVDDRENSPAGGPFYYGFYFDGGLRSFIHYLIGDEPILQDEPFYVHKNYENIDVEAVFVYTDDQEAKELSFANNIHTPDGGMHLTGLRSAMTRSLNDYARKEGYLKEAEENITGDDIREGLVSVISIKLPEPQFEGQTKARLGNPEARTSVEMVVNEALKEFLEKHGSDGRKIIEKNLLAAKARKAAKAAKDTVLRKGALEGLTLPGKLADCSSKKAEDSELFIVEGDSAGGCFDGNTRVALTDGRNLSFKELIEENRSGKNNFCYTIRENGRIGIAPITNLRITKKNASVIKLILDNGEELICTPDHKFMMADGTYKEAREIKNTDSLMPLYRQHSKLWKRIIDAVLHYNHKIIRIEKVMKKTDVYDLEVPNTHNFALAAGVFVHNSAKQGRDRHTQAILPLKGKIMNVEKSRIDKMLVNKEIRSLVIALGTAISENFDIEKLRYHKIILMTDADVDGAHIRTLLLTLFYRYFQKIIENGHLYIAQPPLFHLQKGKEMHYAYSDAERDKIHKAMGSEGINVQRYKGLGEMNPTQLWETTMDPNKRVLKQINVEDAVEADKLFDILMGELVEPRKNFIQAHALTVKNLDI